jgi:uncharacterized membrane protein
MEAFSDGVLAIIITIMVLELRPPHSANSADLAALWPSFASYALSFVFLGIYWNNHHHLLQAARHVSGAVLWANMHLLFWLSLVPFSTAWLGEGSLRPLPTATYGFVLLMAAIAYYVLAHLLSHVHGRESAIATALGRDWKGKVSVLMYGVAIVVAWVAPVVSCLIYLAIALVWFIPDRRFEHVIRHADEPGK